MFDGDFWTTRNTVLVFIAGALATWAMVASATSGRDPDPSYSGTSAVAPAIETCKDIVYYVDGTADSISVTIENATGGTDQADNLAVPLGTDGVPGHRAGCFDPGEFVYISAQNEGDTGAITCRIAADGITIAESSSSAAYGIASCSGSVP